MPTFIFHGDAYAMCILTSEFLPISAHSRDLSTSCALVRRHLVAGDDGHFYCNSLTTCARTILVKIQSLSLSPLLPPPNSIVHLLLFSSATLAGRTDGRTSDNRYPPTGGLSRHHRPSVAAFTHHEYLFPLTIYDPVHLLHHSSTIPTRRRSGE